MPPYQIPYGVIVPAKSENLLVPVACSASHFGFGALRLEPIWCSLGQAAGWAASLSLTDLQSVQDVDVTKLQSLLRSDRSATIYISDVSPTSPNFASTQWFGTLGGLHGHFADLDKPLDDVLATRWIELLNLNTAGGAETRWEFIEKARTQSANSAPRD